MNLKKRRDLTMHWAAILALAMAGLAGAASTAIANPVVAVDGQGALSIQGGGEASTLTVSTIGGQYEVTRTGGSLVSGDSPCLLVASNKVSCGLGANTPSKFIANLGAGTDTITFDGSLPNDLTAEVTEAGSVTSQSVALDATLNEARSMMVANGGPMPDTINIQSPTACFATVNSGGGDDHVRVNVDGSAAGSTCIGSTQNTMTGGEGDDMINAEESAINFKYNASADHDIFMGGSGNDIINVGDGPDWAFGGAGHDRFYDNGGNMPSKLWGGPGNDVYTDWDPDEADVTFFDGGSGVDSVAYRNTTDNFNVRVSTDGVADDGINAGAEQDNIHPSVEGIGSDSTYNDSGQFRGDDVLIGSAAANIIYGRLGNDEIHGEGGDDLLYGGPGSDYFYCGDGVDTIVIDENDMWDEDCEIIN